jgi:proton glutamate symport protein
MNRLRSQNGFLAAFLAMAGLAAVIWALGRYGHLSIPAGVVHWLWRGAVAMFVGYAVTRRSLTAWIILGMLAGVEIGYDLKFLDDATRLRYAAHFQVLSSIFLRLIKTIVAPLIFGTLVVGIAGHSNLKQVGRMGIKSLIYFEAITTLALFIGLAAINISQAGVGAPRGVGAAPPPAAQPEKAADIILKIFPENIAKSVAEAQVLQVVVFSILFAIALALISEEKRRPMLAFCESLSETMFKFTNIVMWFAPIGVLGAMTYTIGTMGLEVLKNLFSLLATLYAALAVFLLCVLLPVALLARLPLKRFVKAVAEPVSIAFATASSESALPRAMESMEAFGVPRQIVAFVLPTGYSFNLDGSTLYLALSSIFVAQAAGIHLGFGQQLAIVFTLMLTSKGVAGVPRAMVVILMGTVDSFHLPAWPVLIILGIDQLMDMARTATNVLGNCLAAAVIARWEGELGKEAPSPTAMDAVAQ